MLAIAENGQVNVRASNVIFCAFLDKINPLYIEIHGKKLSLLVMQELLLAFKDRDSNMGSYYVYDY